MYQTGNHVYVLVKNVELDHKVLALPGDDEDIFREVVEDHEAMFEFEIQVEYFAFPVICVKPQTLFLGIFLGIEAECEIKAHL